MLGCRCNRISKCNCQQKPPAEISHVKLVLTQKPADRLQQLQKWRLNNLKEFLNNYVILLFLQNNVVPFMKQGIMSVSSVSKQLKSSVGMGAWLFF